MKFVKDLIGKEVINTNAIIVGKIHDIEFDPDTQIIESLILKKGSISDTLNISKGENVIPFDLIENIGDKIILKDTNIL